MCEHSKRSKLFCLSPECTHVTGYGCADCMRKAHKGGSEGRLISEQDLLRAMKAYQIPSHIKEQRKKTVLKVYQALTSLKNQICDNLDSYFNSILSKVKYPFLYHEEILEVYRTVRDRNFHRVDRPSLTKFWTLSAALHPDELIAKEVSIYNAYLGETEVSFRALAASMGDIERIFSFKVSYHTRILQQEVSEELARHLKRQPDSAAKAKATSELEPSSPVGRTRDLPHSKMGFFSAPRKQSSNQEGREKKEDSLISAISRRSLEQTTLRWDDLGKNGSSVSKSQLTVERESLGEASSTERLEELPIMKALGKQSIYSNVSSHQGAFHNLKVFSQRYTSEVENEAILITVTEALDRNELANIDNLPPKNDEGKSTVMREIERKPGLGRRQGLFAIQEREDNIKMRLQAIFTQKQPKVLEKHQLCPPESSLQQPLKANINSDKQRDSLKETSLRQSFYLSTSHRRKGSRNESEINDSLGKEIFDFSREEKPRIISRSIKKEIPLTAELSSSRIEGSSSKKSSSEDPGQSLREKELEMAAIFLAGINQPSEQNKVYFLERYVDKYKSNITAVEYLSYLYLQRGRFKECYALSSKMLQTLRSPRERAEIGLTLVVNKAAALNSMGRYSEAIRLLEEVRGECDRVHKNLGDAYCNIEMLEKAIYHYERAIKLNGRLDEAYFNLAVVLFRQGSHFNARMNIEQAISLNPSELAYCELREHIAERIRMNEGRL